MYTTEAYWCNNQLWSAAYWHFSESNITTENPETKNQGNSFNDVWALQVLITHAQRDPTPFMQYSVILGLGINETPNHHGRGIRPTYVTTYVRMHTVFDEHLQLIR